MIILWRARVRDAFAYIWKYMNHTHVHCPLSPCINIKAHFLLSKGSLALSAFTTGSLGRSELRALKTAGEEKQRKTTIVFSLRRNFNRKKTPAGQSWEIKKYIFWWVESSFLERQIHDDQKHWTNQINRITHILCSIFPTSNWSDFMYAFLKFVSFEIFKDIPRNISAFRYSRLTGQQRA